MHIPPPDVLRLEVRALLARLGRDAPFADADDVFERGVIKSLNLIELIGFVEDTYGIEVAQRDVFEGRLRSVDQLVAYVASRIGGRA